MVLLSASEIRGASVIIVMVTVEVGVVILGSVVVAVFLLGV